MKQPVINKEILTELYLDAFLLTYGDNWIDWEDAVALKETVWMNYSYIEYSQAYQINSLTDMIIDGWMLESKKLDNKVKVNKEKYYGVS